MQDGLLMSFTCPKCRRVSHNPNDERERYCGYCHEFIGEAMLSEEDYQFNLAQVKHALVALTNAYPLLPGLVYTSPYDFILRHGVEYRPRPWSFVYPQGTQKQCYGNAITLAAKYKLKYVEGVVLTPDGQVILHGWNATATNSLVDSTWMNTGLLYLGVEFSVERGDDAAWNGDAHVLNDENRNYPVFQKIWQGEDYTIQWPHSDRLKALYRYMQTGEYETPASIEAWMKEQAE
jgi:hypothetical protein